VGRIAFEAGFGLPITGDAMTNVDWAKSILNQCLANGVDEFVICPGARNAAFVEVLTSLKDLPIYSFFEERSAGFFALGRAAATGRPKAVITTSGTAVANLLPPIVEAYYAGFPLVVISADRPQSYRGSGAPQTIIQPGIFSEYAVRLGDLAKGDLLERKIPLNGPSHLNVCFDEPLIDAKSIIWYGSPLELNRDALWCAQDSIDLQSFAALAKSPLILVGGINPWLRDSVLEWLTQQNAPIYAEACSGLRGHPALQNLELQAAEKTLRREFFDAVVRIGTIPTTRFWRDLEVAKIPVLSISELEFPGLSGEVSRVLPLTKKLLEPDRLFFSERLGAVRLADEKDKRRLEELLQAFPHSEPAWVRKLSLQVGIKDRVYLGNSLPIREWDLAATREVCFNECFANRGANGIDGQLSTFLGWASLKQVNWALLGDLTTLYDLSGPWALQQRPLEQFRFVIINNGGGKIFKPMFHESLFENRHAIAFAEWSKMWSLPHIVWDGSNIPDSSGVVEIVPDEEQTEAFRRQW
jgi:2-succinyl-5-enolpyruvyl-6-hydroxy-3-cyclohexene-1-carboxylate synthase